jgi:hypothetical protein
MSRTNVIFYRYRPNAFDVTQTDNFQHQRWSVDSEDILPVKSKLISKLPIQLNKCSHRVKCYQSIVNQSKRTFKLL